MGIEVEDGDRDVKINGVGKERGNEGKKRRKEETERGKEEKRKGRKRRVELKK